MSSFENKNVVITGASRGIGLATVKKFVTEGANVIACSSHDSTETRQLYSDIESNLKGRIQPLFFDLSEESSVKEGIKHIKELTKEVDVLVNNAGIGKLSLFAFTKANELKRIFQVNFFSQIMIIQGLIGVLRRSESPSIVNLASIAGIDGGIGALGYGSSKASIILATRVLAEELAPLHIRVNAVAPGMVDTDLSKQMGNEAIKRAKGASFLKRLASPDEIANVIFFLASNNSNYINGQIIRIDGGM